MTAGAAVLASYVDVGRWAEAGQSLRLARLVRLSFPQQRSSSLALDMHGKLGSVMLIGRRYAGQQQLLLVWVSCLCA